MGCARARRSRSRDSGWAERQRWIHLLQVRRYVHVVGIRALDWRRPASREGRDASQERTLILNRGPSCSERQSNERVFRGRITVVHPSGPERANRFRLSIVCRVTLLCERDRGIPWRRWSDEFIRGSLQLTDVSIHLEQLLCRFHRNVIIVTSLRNGELVTWLSRKGSTCSILSAILKTDVRGQRIVVIRVRCTCVCRVCVCHRLCVCSSNQCCSVARATGDPAGECDRSAPAAHERKREGERGCALSGVCRFRLTGSARVRMPPRCVRGVVATSDRDSTASSAATHSVDWVPATD